MKKLNICVLLAGVAVVLAACGGGGGGNGMPPVQVDPLDALPPEATQSVSSWIGFLQGLARASGAELREGFGVSSSGVTSVPGDDVADPTVLAP